MFSFEKAVAWQNWNEWEDVYNLLYSGNQASILQGVAKVSAWSARLPIPTAVEVTASLQQNMYQDPNVLGLSLSIIRFINGVVEPFKQMHPSNSISSIGSSLGIPDYITQIRHSATHGKLPSFDFACFAAQEALKWLQENYWLPQLTAIIRYKNDLHTSIIGYLTKNEDPFEFFQPNIIASFGVDALIDIMLNKNQNRGTLKLNFMKKVGDLIQETSKFLSYFPAAVGMKLAEKMAQGNSLASIWIEYLLNRGLAPRKSVSMILNCADPEILQKSLPDPVIEIIGKLDHEKIQWPPTSIGNLPINTENLTLLTDEFCFAEEVQEIPENSSKEDVKEETVEQPENNEAESNEQPEETQKSDGSSDEIELW
ncbi:Las1-like family protein [Trichomonas vaginalis G3]|uniref:Las1-like family protein n=1 Tax=Trichomonas vaginalis (strain ATCC PRA-98 / G3) TaxID=412133 RepID=A2E3C5_TRIV3|nr:endonucleolytic cleavage involved in rRNA processing [Trichomonas vaginalis G3]EAY12816.1 Las1-like family protein [Trichomonas vaginalis G3]KAI5488526.1 endonucleolytic cleavage involved in rRNA processing [Trichomonas vaginalis G3]|eukprot:XP_001325039.1 Las1-like family protein [Trichomonas vaginalis G3]